MNEEILTKLFIEFAEWLEMHGADNLTKGVEPYAQEFARQKVKLFAISDVSGSKSKISFTETFGDNSDDADYSGC